MTERPDEFTALRDRLGTLEAPTVSIQEIAEQIDMALLRAKRFEQLARAPGNSPDAIMSTALDVHIAANDAAEAFKALKGVLASLEADCAAAASVAKTGLSAAMWDSGAPDTETATHRAASTDPTDKTVVEDLGQLPQDCVEYVPSPIRKLITAKLVAGQKVPGAKLVKGEPGLRITAKKNLRGGAA